MLTVPHYLFCVRENGMASEWYIILRSFLSEQLEFLPPLWWETKEKTVLITPKAGNKYACTVWASTYSIPLLSLLRPPHRKSDSWHFSRGKTRSTTEISIVTRCYKSYAIHFVRFQQIKWEEKKYSLVKIPPGGSLDARHEGLQPNFCVSAAWECNKFKRVAKLWVSPLP